MFHGHLDYFQQPPLGGRPITEPRDHGTPNAHNHWFVLCYHVWGSVWIELHWTSIWLRARSHMASHYTWGFVTTLTWFWRRLGTAFRHFLLGSHNFLVTTLGSCVKWPSSEDVKYPPRTNGDSIFRAGAALPRNFCPRPVFSKPARK
jgi:hypothetical protein